MPALWYPGAPATGRLLLLLPGRGDSDEEFARRGFVGLARASGLTADIVAADAHFGYYENRSISRRLAADLVQPARAEGRSDTWVSGISLGGWGSIVLARDYPGLVQGLVVLSPFLGPERVTAEIEAAGGLARWAPTRLDEFEEIWWWLKGYATAADRPALYLAFGESDRFIRSERLLAAVLPPDHVFTVPGGHDWSTFLRLWRWAVALPALKVQPTEARSSTVAVRSVADGWARNRP